MMEIWSLEESSVASQVAVSQEHSVSFFEFVPIHQ